jgi:hypothetical protein
MASESALGGKRSDLTTMLYATRITPTFHFKVCALRTTAYGVRFVLCSKHALGAKAKGVET